MPRPASWWRPATRRSMWRRRCSRCSLACVPCVCARRQAWGHSRGGPPSRLWPLLPHAPQTSISQGGSTMAHQLQSWPTGVLPQRLLVAAATHTSASRGTAAVLHARSNFAPCVLLLPAAAGRGQRARRLQDAACRDGGSLGEPRPQELAAGGQPAGEGCAAGGGAGAAAG